MEASIAALGHVSNPQARSLRTGHTNVAAMPTQIEWFEKTTKDWNDSHEQKVVLEYVPNSEYINGPKLATAFASGEGPDIFLRSPGDFSRHCNGGVLADLPPSSTRRRRRTSPKAFSRLTNPLE